jgi:GntR family transcriptional regulator / MocR family aminotransferase
MRNRPKQNLIALDRSSTAPLYRQIYERVRDGIAAGALRPGDRLPSARGLALQFGTARGTVDAAYGLLQGEGYVIARGPAGSVVSPALTAQDAVRGGRPQRERGGAPAPWGGEPTLAPLAFRMGLPALDLFPRKVWSRLATRRARALSGARMDYPHPAGHALLREAIAAYLAISRGIRCSPRQILITNGYQGALDLIAAVLLRAGDAVWFEDPGYFRARATLKAAGAKLVPIRVDREGLRVTDGIARAPHARLAVTTPAHQSPLGMALSLPRRIALLAWAGRYGAFVIEDDYDGEFRYVGNPLPALKSLDREERVLYAGSFSKVLFPALRLGYLVVPQALIEDFVCTIERRQGAPASFEQFVVADFVAEGHFARHLKRMRGLYAARRHALAKALSSVFGARLSVELEPGGMHLIARLPDAVSDVEVAACAQASGFALEALSSRAMTHPCGQGLLLGFANVAEPDALPMCRQLERAIGKKLGARACG